MRKLRALLPLAAAACAAASLDPDHRCELSAPGPHWLAYAYLESGDYGISLARSDGTCRLKIAQSPSMELHPAWSSAGVLAFTSDRSGALRIWLHDLATGADALLDTGDVRATSPAFSPDGATIAFEGKPAGATNTDIYVIPAAGGAPSPLALDAADDAGPAWSPDGGTIYFVSTRSGAYEIHSVTVATGNVVRVTTGSRIIGRPAVSPAGDRLYFARTKGGSSDTEVVRLVLGTGAIEVVSSQGDSEPAVSPSGDRLAMRTFRYGTGAAKLVMVNEADGLGAVQVTDGASSDGAPAFQPAH